MTLNLLARLSLALLVALPVAAQAQEESPPLPERNPLRAHAKSEPALPGDVPTVAWTDAEVAKAKAACAKLLAGLALDYEVLPPIKEGRCGAPAPILLKAVGSDPKVEIDPPATVTCALASALSRWLGKTVQPEARALAGAPVVKLGNASAYVCRNRYNGTDTLLSEHALANALDISEFVFQSGERVTVVASWPRVVTAPPLPLPKPTRVSVETTGSIAPAPVARAKTIEAIDVTQAKVSAKTNPFVRPTSVAKVPPPMPPAEASAPAAQPLSDRKSDFVRKVHDDACKIFGTVLGPEANDAHKDHFHLDMKARRRSAFCE
jgi:hypothetical protein